MSFHSCPCCGRPTLEAVRGDTCPLCFWDDREGANGEVTLRAAQANFAAHGHMFGANDPQAPRDGALRARLVALAQTQPFDEAGYRAWLDDWNDWSC